MNYGGALIPDIARLLETLAPHCRDRETFDWLLEATHDKSKWQKAHGVFGHIRSKYLKAEKRGHKLLMAQYQFEEICAKTIYNMSGMPAPFDADSPYWLVPNAISFVRTAGLSDSVVINCLSLQRDQRSV